MSSHHRRNREGESKHSSRSEKLSRGTSNRRNRSRSKSVEKSRHRPRNRSVEMSRHRSRSRSAEQSRYRDDRSTSRRHGDHKSDRNGRYRFGDVQIKKEEDFDERQEEARQRRIKRESDRVKEEQDRRQRDYVKPAELKRERSFKQEGEYKQEGGFKQERHDNDVRRREHRQQNSNQIQNALAEQAQGEAPPVEKEKPNFGLSGQLTASTNTFRGHVIKYNEPPEARMPKKMWRLYEFKGDSLLKVHYLHRQSAFLMGRIKLIADFLIENPTCSKQHAVFQYRAVEKTEKNGRKKQVIRPYIIDLGSANGTKLNGEPIEPQRYVELKAKDCLNFGLSERDYVLIHDTSDTSKFASDDVSDAE